MSILSTSVGAGVAIGMGCVLSTFLITGAYCSTNIAGVQTPSTPAAGVTATILLPEYGESVVMISIRRSALSFLYCHPVWSRSLRIEIRLRTCRPNTPEWTHVCRTILFCMCTMISRLLVGSEARGGLITA